MSRNATQRHDLESPASKKIQQTRPWLGLVDLSRTPSGTFFREVHPALEMGCKHRQNRLFRRVCVIWPQKHERRFFTKVRSQRGAHFFVYHRPQGAYADLTSKLQREQPTGTPPFYFPSSEECNEDSARFRGLFHYFIDRNLRNLRK